MKTLRLILHGRVQGVTYRWFTRRAAQKHGVQGFARNLPDGTLEIVAQGSDEDLAPFLAEVKKGPMWARVDKIVETKALAEDFDDFDVRWW